MASTISTYTPSLRKATLAAIAAFAALSIWDASGFDRTLATWLGGIHGFPLRGHWFLTSVLHEGGRTLSWLMVLALCLGVWKPGSVLSRLDFSRRLQLATTTLVAALAVSLMKAWSTTSCPWDLSEFGGVAHYVPHWRPAVPDGGPGHCFPAGHASSGFAFIGGFFSFRAHGESRLANIWLAASLFAGLLLGIGQQFRGAHFMSHTLWTGWICWVVALAMHAAWPRQLMETS
jgi:membrane-associated PAP2 superfamily phosphatase